MSTADRRVDPTTAAVASEPVHDFVPGRPSGPAFFSQPAARHAADEEQEQEPAAATGGGLRRAYTQYVVDPETHEVSVRIRDAATDAVIGQIPAAEVAAANKALREYAGTLALRHAAAQARAGA
jgi:hypothetical protein